MLSVICDVCTACGHAWTLSHTVCVVFTLRTVVHVHCVQLCAWCVWGLLFSVMCCLRVERLYVNCFCVLWVFCVCAVCVVLALSMCVVCGWVCCMFCVCCSMCVFHVCCMNCVLLVLTVVMYIFVCVVLCVLSVVLFLCFLSWCVLCALCF